MLRIAIFMTLVAAVAVSFAVGRRPNSESHGKAARRILYYVDPMHPSYKSDKPGIAPDCGMKLEPVYEADSNRQAGLTSADRNGGAVAVDNTALSSAGIRLTQVQSTPAIYTIHVVGRVVPEDTRTYRINSGIDGFVRETFDDSAGTLVKKNQKLATYYAPDFLAATSGFLAANERVPGSLAAEGARSIQNYTDRLRNLGMSDLQINQVASTRKLPESIEILSPADGVILSRSVTTGQHFEHEMELYRIADLSRVWIVAEVDQQDEADLRPGTSGKVSRRDVGEVLPARVAHSLPESEPSGGTVKIRLEADNPHLSLRPDMLVDVAVPVVRPPAITVPVNALLDSGVRPHVFVESKAGVFEPREVETGWRRGDRVQILKGLRVGERVVAEGAFLIDSESRLDAVKRPSETAPGANLGPLSEAENQ